MLNWCSKKYLFITFFIFILLTFVPFSFLMNKSIFFFKVLTPTFEQRFFKGAACTNLNCKYFVSMYLYCVHVYISPVVQQSLHKPCDRGYEGYPALSPRLSLDLLQQTDKTKKAQQRTSQTAVHHMTHHTLHTHTDSPGCPAEH